jgi:hypothetical protein
VKQNSIEVEYKSYRRRLESLPKTSTRIWHGTHDLDAWTVIVLSAIGRENQMVEMLWLTNLMFVGSAFILI